MKNKKTLTVVLTLSITIIAILSYMVATNKLVGISSDSPIILLDANNNATEKVSSTELAKDETNQDLNEEKNLTVTSRSGKHEALENVTEATTIEAEANEAITAETNVVDVEVATIDTSIEEQVENLAQEPVEEQKPTYEGVELEYSERYSVCSSPLTKSKGVTYYNGHKETYYSQRVLAGKGLKMLNNNGRHVADDGTVRDGDGYIAVACNYLPKGSEIMTSLGPGKVYDTGSMTGKWIDIYVNW